MTPEHEETRLYRLIAERETLEVSLRTKESWYFGIYAYRTQYDLYIDVQRLRELDDKIESYTELLRRGKG